MIKKELMYILKSEIRLHIILSLNNLLPDDQFDTALRTELPFFCNGRNIDLSIENYTRYYQYYPNFHHVSF